MKNKGLIKGETINSKEGIFELKIGKKVKKVQKVQLNQIENRSVLKMGKYGIYVDVFHKSEDGCEKEYVFFERKEFIEIQSANTYLRENDNINKLFKVVLARNLVIDNSTDNVFNYADLEAGVLLALDGYQITVTINQTFCVCGIEGGRWKENSDGNKELLYGKFVIEKGKNLSVLQQNNVQDPSPLKVEAVEIEGENNGFVIGRKEALKQIIFRQVVSHKPLKKLEINGFFCYEQLDNEEKNTVRISDTLSVHGVAVLNASVRVKNLVLEGKLSVSDFKSTGVVKTNNGSCCCILSGGKAEVNDIKLTFCPEMQRQRFCFAMEQQVELEDYKHCFAEEWEEIYGEIENGKLCLEDIFAKVRLLEERGKLVINGNIKFRGEIDSLIRMEKYFCWKAKKEDSEETVSFKSMVEFHKSTVIENGETIAVIPKTSANNFFITYDGICLSKYGKALKAVVSTVEVLLEGTNRMVEYENFEDAVENLKTDFDIESIPKGQKIKFIFSFLTDQVLTKNITFPKFVSEVKLVSERIEKEEAYLVKKLELNEYTLSVPGILDSSAGVRIISSGKPGNIKLTGKKNEAGLKIYTWEKYYRSLGQIYEKERYYPLENVNVLSANGCVFIGGQSATGIKGNIIAYECVIGSNTWHIDNITATNVFLSTEREEQGDDGVILCHKEGRLVCDKLTVTGKMILEEKKMEYHTKQEDKVSQEPQEGEEIFAEQQNEEKKCRIEKVRCNSLNVKYLELHNGLVHVANNAIIGDVFLLDCYPEICVSGEVFQIKGNVLCGAANGCLTTGLNRKKESALCVEGKVEVLQNETHGVSANKLTVKVAENDSVVDLRQHENIKNILLKVKSASETVFLAEDCHGPLFDFKEKDDNSYVLRKYKNNIEVLSGDKVSVALYQQDKEEKLIQCYADITEAVMAIDKLKNKEADYVIKLRNSIGKDHKKGRIDLQFPRYAKNVTFSSEEESTIYCNKNIVQRTNVKLENIHLKSISDYSVTQGELELFNSKVEVDKLNLKKIKLLNSDIVTSGNSFVKELFLVEAFENENKSSVMAAKKMKVKKVEGIGNLVSYGNVMVANAEGQSYVDDED